MTPTLLYVDTSAWYALLDRKDRNHASAVRFLQDSHVPLVTSTYVLDEAVTLVKRHLGHAMAARFGDQLWTEEIARLVRVSPEDEMVAEDTLVQDDATSTARLQTIDHGLEEEQLRRPGLVGEAGLRLLTLLPAEWRMHPRGVRQTPALRSRR